MRIIPIIITLLFNVFALSAQDAKDIFKKTYDKCSSIQNGHYEYTKYSKTLNATDTGKMIIDCNFKKLKNDSVYSLAFHYQIWIGGKRAQEVLYTGEDFVEANANDSTATIMSKSNWAQDIKSQKHNYTNNFYEPFMDIKNSAIFTNKNLTNDKFSFKYIREEKVNNISCYHIQVNMLSKGDENTMMESGRLKVLRNEWHIWVSKFDFIPVQYSTFVDLIIDNEKQHQYERFTLSKYEVNNYKNEDDLTLNSIPIYYSMKDYSPHKFPELLVKETLAPNWQLSSLNGEKISLSDLKGEMVLMDFFFKACAPCIQAMPSLKALHEKYKDKGLHIIGIDPVDHKAIDMKPFLEKKGITYNVLLDNDYEVAKAYQVSYYPTVYLIDENGKIIFTQVGYKEETEKLIKKIISDRLDR